MKFTWKSCCHLTQKGHYGKIILKISFSYFSMWGDDPPFPILFKQFKSYICSLSNIALIIWEALPNRIFFVLFVDPYPNRFGYVGWLLLKIIFYSIFYF